MGSESDLVVEGQGAVTVIEGLRMPMEGNGGTRKNNNINVDVHYFFNY
jgi:hypothetical protein